MLKPLSDNIVLEAVKEEKKKTSIILPEDSEKEKPGTGKVVSVGPGKIVDGKRQTMDVKKGDVVFYKKYSEHKIKDGDKEYIIVKSDDILAIK